VKLCSPFSLPFGASLNTVPTFNPAREWRKISPQSAASKTIMVRTLGGNIMAEGGNLQYSVEFALALGNLSVA
jgi:hypothetical protein